MRRGQNEELIIVETSSIMSLFTNIEPIRLVQLLNLKVVFDLYYFEAV